MSATPEQMREISRRISSVLDEHVKRCPACNGVVQFKLGPLVELKERDADFPRANVGVLRASGAAGVSAVQRCDAVQRHRSRIGGSNDWPVESG